MSLSVREASQLRKLVKIAENILASADKAQKEPALAKKTSKREKRRRRSGKELVAFQKMLKAERKRGVPVAELARQHGISSAYIYQIK